MHKPITVVFGNKGGRSLLPKIFWVKHEHFARINILEKKDRTTIKKIAFVHSSFCFIHLFFFLNQSPSCRPIACSCAVCFHTKLLKIWTEVNLVMFWILKKPSPINMSADGLFQCRFLFYSSHQIYFCWSVLFKSFILILLFFLQHVISVFCVSV